MQVGDTGHIPPLIFFLTREMTCALPGTYFYWLKTRRLVSTKRKDVLVHVLHHSWRTSLMRKNRYIRKYINRKQLTRAQVSVTEIGESSKELEQLIRTRPRKAHWSIFSKWVSRRLFAASATLFLYPAASRSDLECTPGILLCATCGRFFRCWDIYSSVPAISWELLGPKLLRLLLIR